MSHWPLEPLMALARTRDGDRMSMKELSLTLGLSPSTVQGWKTRGIPTDDQAEAAAAACGFDPYTVWGEEWTQAQFAAFARPCEECGELFIGQSSRRRFCSDGCRTRKWARESYARDAEKRAKQAVYRRQYYAYSGEYERKRERQRYWADPEAKRKYAREYRAKKKAERQGAA